MSYSSDTKAELLDKIPRARHCQIAELASFFTFFGKVRGEDGKRQAGLSAETEGIRKVFFTLVQKTINITLYASGNGDAFLPAEETDRFLAMIRYRPDQSDRIDRLLVQQPCCRKAALRAAFLSAGSITDPGKGYHLEITARTPGQADWIRDLMQDFGLSAKIVLRQGRQVVYLKESDEISEMLGLMEAYVTMMDFENVRVEKDLHNTVNRKVNCETANIDRMVRAAVREIEDIRLIEEKRGLRSLPEKLRETAEKRLEYPEMPLKELGLLFDPPVGKSGVNHRLRRIGEIAETLRKQEAAEGK